MAFGLRGEADTQYLNITSPSYWEVYAGGWITVNGQVSYISHGNAAVAITVVNPPVPPGWNGTSTYTDTGTIHVQDYTSGCSDFIITITYTVCPSC
ncbi:MAG TPA: hypothetical protein VK517_19730 [Cyclobacteriaceae bacterium]|nr:hypothetical protein [Cyclobacteriaceae bacterium]